jgi:hypothetical protein
VEYGQAGSARTNKIMRTSRIQSMTYLRYAGDAVGAA